MELKLEDLEKLIMLQNKEIEKLESHVASAKQIIENANVHNATLEKENHSYHEKLRKLNGRLTIIMEGHLELVKTYPDIWLHTNRWKTRRYVSQMVNEVVTHADICHNCGCCNDSPLEVWPYLEQEGVKVYSDPPTFIVGEKCGYGDRPYDNWEENLKKAGIPVAMIQKVQEHFDENSHFFDEEEESD